MNRKKAKTGNGIYKIAAILAAAVLLAGIGLPGQTALVSHASNSLGSQGSALDGGNASDAGSEAVDEGAADNTDEEVQAVIDENTEDLNGTSTASRIRVIAASGRVRAEASTDSSVVGSLSSGDEMDVVGETTGSDGYVWYQISGEKNGEAVNGYVRSDVVEVTETTQPETTEQPATETPSEPASESAATSTDEYSVSYADDGTGVSDWYLNDNINGTEEDRYDEDEEPPRRSSRQSGSRQSGSRQTSRGKSRNAYKPRNFLDVDDDDDLDFEFLDLK